MKKTVSLVSCCLLLCLVSFNNTKAQIKITGLDNAPEISAYIQKTVVEKYNSDKDQPIRFARVKADIEKALKAKGYYDPKVIYREDEGHKFEVKTGSIYIIEKTEVKGIEDISAPSLHQDDILEAETVLKAQKDLFNQISNDRCFYNLSVKHEIILNRETKTALVRFLVEGEDDAKFGKTDFSGADSIKRKYLSRFLKYKEGECWSPKKLEATRAALLETGLLSSIDLNLPENLPNDKSVPLSFRLKERAARNVRLGAQYSLSEGPGVSAEWRHRNYFGSGEQLSVLTQISTLLQSIGLDFTKPFFLSKKQSLNISSSLERQDTDAFEELSINAQASISRKLSDSWTGNLGVALETSKITDEDGEEETFGLVSFPARLNFDNRDNPLDPHKGYSFAFGVEPFVDAFGESDPFFKTRMTGTTYFDLSESRYDPVLALRGSVGSILGSDTDNIPATERFFAGGGGSIRGFGFQEAGPVDEDNDPLGGRSIIEGTAELRLKFTDTIGGVAFVDGGGVYDSSFPDFEDGVFLGAGVGARYYTGFGPIRFDVAVPLNKRDQTDQNFQIYISIGQAF